MSDSISIGWHGPNQNCWEWILGHFRDVVELREQDIAAWRDSSAKHSEAGRTITIIASEHRGDGAVEIAKELEQSDSTVPWCLLLGSDWDGHRRTAPFPESWRTFYWYQIYDLLLPWLAELAVTTVVPRIVDDSHLNKRKISPRVQRWLDFSERSSNLRMEGSVSNSTNSTIALCVTETATARQFWFDAFSRRNIPCVVTTPDNVNVWVQPELVVVDVEPKPFASQKSGSASGDTDRSELLQRIRQQFPNSVQIVTDAFPRWERWLSLIDSGADILVAKPFYLDGILDAIQLCR